MIPALASPGPAAFQSASARIARGPGSGANASGAIETRFAPQQPGAVPDGPGIEFGVKPGPTVTLPPIADQAQAAEATQHACRLLQQRSREALSIQANSSAQRVQRLLS